LPLEFGQQEVFLGSFFLKKILSAEVTITALDHF
jgi:hypothetical protein